MTISVTQSVINRLLSGDVLEQDVTADERSELAQLRRKRLIVRYTGPGPAWYRLTRQGRIELTDDAPKRPEPMF